MARRRRSRTARDLEARDLIARAARARTSDPRTSKKAGREIAPHLGKLQARVEALVLAHPGMTGRELADIDGCRDVQTIRRRLHEVEELGRIRRGEPRPCSVTKRSAHTWWPP